MTTEGNNADDTSTLMASTMIYAEETTRSEEEATPTEVEVDYTATGQMDTETTSEPTTPLATTIDVETSTVKQPAPRLIHVLTNSSQSRVTEEPFSPTMTMVESTTGKRTTNFNVEKSLASYLTVVTTSVNPCTLENLRANFVYHEYPPDHHKFIFCDSEGKMNIIACSPNYVWSQSEQSCILPV